MQRTNVGGLDRLGRAVAAVALLVVAGRANRRGNRVVAELSTLAATSFLFNVVTGFCAGNAMLGKDTSASGPHTGSDADNGPEFPRGSEADPAASSSAE